MFKLNLSIKGFFLFITFSLAPLSVFFNFEKEYGAFVICQSIFFGVFGFFYGSARGVYLREIISKGAKVVLSENFLFLFLMYLVGCFIVSFFIDTGKVNFSLSSFYFFGILILFSNIAYVYFWSLEKISLSYVFEYCFILAFILSFLLSLISAIPWEANVIYVWPVLLIALFLLFADKLEKNVKVLASTRTSSPPLLLLLITYINQLLFYSEIFFLELVNNIEIFAYFKFVQIPTLLFNHAFNVWRHTYLTNFLRDGINSVKISLFSFVFFLLFISFYCFGHPFFDNSNPLISGLMLSFFYLLASIFVATGNLLSIKYLKDYMDKSYIVISLLSQIITILFLIVAFNIISNTPAGLSIEYLIYLKILMVIPLPSILLFIFFFSRLKKMYSRVY